MSAFAANEAACDDGGSDEDIAPATVSDEEFIDDEDVVPRRRRNKRPAPPPKDGPPAKRKRPLPESLWGPFDRAIDQPMSESLARDLLNLAPDATPGQVKKAYRRLAAKLHPDKNTHEHAGQHFQVLSAANDLLVKKGGAAKPDAKRGKKARGKRPAASPRRASPEEGVREIVVEVELGSLMERRTPWRNVVLMRHISDGRVEERMCKFMIIIPAGATDGDVVGRFARQGDWSPDGSSDLIFRLRVLDEPGVRRDGQDIHVKCRVPLHEVLDPGHQLTVKALGRTHQLRLPDDAWHGEKILYPGRGLPKPGSSGHGALVVSLEVMRPNPPMPGLVSEMREQFRYRR